MSLSPIRYTLCPQEPAAHLFHIRCHVENPDPAGQKFALPAWIPGSYLIRDFARHIVSIHAESAQQAIPLRKLDKHTWQAAPVPPQQSLTVCYQVYAWDLSVRGAHLDQTHAFFNGCSVFLRVLGQEDHPCLVDLQAPVLSDPTLKPWRIASTLARAKKSRGRTQSVLHGFGQHCAENYDELIDHPVEMGCFSTATFEAGGIAHTVVLTGRHDCDIPRLCADLQRVCTWHIELFGTPPPMPHYLFLITVVDEGYGGLEHRNSSAIICARETLPYRGMKAISDGYRKLLGLCSHEYFHAWNVKRIKPKAFFAYNLDCENYTPMLWAFEGFTSYYDDLALCRSGLISEQAWLDLMAKTIDHLLCQPGRLKQSLAESSFDAWSKYYRPDENTPNAGISYYLKGALFALTLDLKLRASTKGKSSLDELMRCLWKDFGQTGRGLDEQDIVAIAERCSGLRLKHFFKSAIHGTHELPLAQYWPAFGIRLERTAQHAHSGLGVILQTGIEEAKLATVYTGSPAERAGLAAGDSIIAIDGLRINSHNLAQRLQRYAAGDRLAILAFRRDVLLSVQLTLAPPKIDRSALIITQKHNRLRQQWLGQPSTSKA